MTAAKKTAAKKATAQRGDVVTPPKVEPPLEDAVKRGTKISRKASEVRPGDITHTTLTAKAHEVTFLANGNVRVVFDNGATKILSASDVVEVTVL